MTSDCSGPTEQRTPWLVFACLVLALVSVAAAPALADERPICVQADEWIAAHEGALPTSYRDFVSLPKGYHRRVFSHLSPAVKADLWRSQIASSLERRDLELSEDQRAFLQLIFPKITAEAFVGRIPPATPEEIRSFFPDAVARIIFTLEPVVAGKPAGPLSGPSLGSSVVTPLAAADCSCYTYNPGWFACPSRWPICHEPLQGGTPCHYVESGCGDWWLDPCDGVCCRRDLSVCF